MVNISMFHCQAKTKVKVEIGIFNNGDLTVVNIYAPNNKAINYVNPKLQKTQGSRERNLLGIGDINTYSQYKMDQVAVDGK